MTGWRRSDGRDRRAAIGPPSARGGPPRRAATTGAARGLIVVANIVAAKSNLAVNLAVNLDSTGRPRYAPESRRRPAGPTPIAAARASHEC
jgi:hypothetical protein